MPKKNKKTTKKIKKEEEKEIKKNFSDTPLLTPIENSEKDIKDRRRKVNNWLSDMGW